MDIYVTPLLKESIILLGAKRKMLHEMKDDLRTIVLGSSHGDFGFDPQYCQDSFNLCCQSQDLKHSSLLYQHIIEQAPKLENLVIFYSVFSPGHFMELDNHDKSVSPALNELFRLNLEYEDELLQTLSNNIKGLLDNFVMDLDGNAGFLPTSGKRGIPEKHGARNRVEKHLKRNSKNEANVYLMNMLLLARSLSHSVYIVVPPVRQDYKAACGQDFNYLFRDLLLLVDLLKTMNPEFNLHVINTFDSDDYPDNYFCDFDHLSPVGEGVEVLSKTINATINAN